MQYCCRIVTLYILCICMLILFNASHIFVINDIDNKEEKRETKNLNEYLKGVSDVHQKPVSRIVNQEEKPVDIYPWLAGVLLDFTTLKGEKEEGGCTGSLISEMYILTAAHCLCWFDDAVSEDFDSSPPESLPSLRCLPNIESVGGDGQSYIEYVDQIQVLSENHYNKVYFVLGAKKLPQFDRLTGNFGTSSCHWSLAEKVIVMNTKTNGQKIDLEKGYDVGLILVPEGDRPRRTKPIEILANAPKYPKYKGSKGYFAGYGRKFAFGEHSDRSPGTKNNPSKYSSCMTSEKGPLDSRFKYCDTRQIFDQGCIKDRYPVTYGPRKRENCKQDWIGAKLAINKLDVDANGKNAERLDKSRIRVYASKPDAGRIPQLNECVNLNWISKYGWCKIADDTQGNWGICSPSCAFLGEKFDKSQKMHGSRYYEIEVSITEQLEKENLKEICDLKDSQLDNDAVMCLKAEIPKTSIGQFYRDKRKSTKLVFDQWVQEDTSRTYGYIGAADGDSGGPIWVRKYTRDTSGARPILIKTDKLIGVEISSDGDDRKMGNKPVETEGVIIGTKINEKILKWINLHTQLENK